MLGVQMSILLCSKRDLAAQTRTDSLHTKVTQGRIGPPGQSREDGTALGSVCDAAQAKPS